jgi:hypothetical protein
MYCVDLGIDLWLFDLIRLSCAPRCKSSQGWAFAPQPSDCNIVEMGLIEHARSEQCSRADEIRRRTLDDMAPRRIVRRSRYSQHLLAGLVRGADWLRPGPAQWDDRVAYRHSPLVQRAILAVAATRATTRG